MAEEGKSELAPQSSIEDLRREFQLIFNEWLESVENQEAIEEKLTQGQTEMVERYIVGLPEQRDRMALFMERLKQEEEIDKASAARHSARANRWRRMREWLLFSAKTVMQLKGFKRVEGKEFGFTIKTNPASVNIINPADVPMEYCSMELVPNKELIKDALKSGKVVPGAVLITDRTRLEVK